MHQLTKTDFIQYLNCPKSLWLLKNKPEVYPKGEFSLFLEKLIKEGYEVEAYAKQLFPNGLDLPENASPSYTQEQLASKHTVFFQPSFCTTKGVFARIDILEQLPDGSVHLYEIKSSTSIKTDKKHNHLKDACFQKYVLQECGYEVAKISMIHLNKTYIRQGDINPQELLAVVDVMADIEELYSSVVNDINAGVNFINKESINEESCTCKYKTKSNHCDAFAYFNPDIPEYNVYQFNGIRAGKLNQFLDQGIIDLHDMPDNIDIDLAPKHIAQLNSLRQGKAIINETEITTAFERLQYPLHFFDYEGYGSSIPQLDGFSPHQQLIFQVSVHTLQADGSLTHYEYLSDSLTTPDDLVAYMHTATNGSMGTFVCWHKTYERDRNKEMMVQVPAYASYLEYINAQLFDLKELFYTGYAHYQFKGSASIKDVLPVMAPHLSYKVLDVQDGTMALDTWGRMVTDLNFDEDIAQTRHNLLEYCKLDTFAMVEIFKDLQKIVV